MAAPSAPGVPPAAPAAPAAPHTQATQATRPPPSNPVALPTEVFLLCLEQLHEITWATENDCYGIHRRHFHRLRLVNRKCFHYHLENTNTLAEQFNQCIQRTFCHQNNTYLRAHAIMTRGGQKAEKTDDTIPAAFLLRLITTHWRDSTRIMCLLKGAVTIVSSALDVSSVMFLAQHGLFMCRRLLDYGPTIVAGIFRQGLASWPESSGLTPLMLSFHLIALLGERLPVSVQKLAVIARPTDTLLLIPTPLGTFAACAARGGSKMIFDNVLNGARDILDIVLDKNVVESAIMNSSNLIMNEIAQRHRIGELPDIYDYKTLLLAARYSPAWLKKLMVHGYPLDGWDDRWTYDRSPRIKKPSQIDLKNRLLHEAARFGQTDALKLFEFTTEALSCRRHAWLPLLASAAFEGRLGTMRWLLDSGVKELEVATCVAAGRGYMTAVKMLMRAGFDVHEPPKALGGIHGFGMLVRMCSLQPVAVAAEQGEFEMVEYFLKEGCGFMVYELKRLRHQLTYFRKPYASDMLALLRKFPQKPGMD
jgi:hypothetical protein